MRCTIPQGHGSCWEGTSRIERPESLFSGVASVDDARKQLDVFFRGVLILGNLRSIEDGEIPHWGCRNLVRLWRIYYQSICQAFLRAMPTGLWACTLLVYNSMLSFKSESSADSASSLGSIPGTLQPELDYWERLIFSFDMDRDDPNKASRSARRGRSRGRSRSQSSTRGLSVPGSNVVSVASFIQVSAVEYFVQPDISDAALLAQFASAAAHQASGSQENPYDNFLQALQVSQGNPYAAYLHSSTGIPGQYYPPSGTGSIPYLPPQGVAWSQLPFQPPLPSPYNLPHNQSLPNFPPSFPSNYPVTPFPQSDAAQGPAPSSSHSPLNSSPSPASPANDDATAGAEDKRRRNTMASGKEIFYHVAPSGQLAAYCTIN